MSTKTINVGYMSRVEGEAALTIKLRGDDVVSAELSIFEPPRLFEAMLRGRLYSEAPDMTARICGICPVAYQMSSCHAMEDALGITISPEIRALRRLLYCGEWIESHVLHMVMLHAPDFFDVPDVAGLAQLHPERVKDALRIKKLGNSILRVLGGREIHPINVKVGGFYKAPTREDLTSLLPELNWALGAAEELLTWGQTFSYPDVAHNYLHVALCHPNEYPLNEGKIVSSAGLSINASDYEQHFAETHEERSNALHTTHRGQTMFCGPLARFVLNYEKLPTRAKEAATRAGVNPNCRNPFKSLLVRGVETIFALDEAIRVVEAYEPPTRAFETATPRAGVGCAATEAPRGLLYHRYHLDDSGLITDAKIVPPTSQNQRVMEEDLYRMGKMLAALPSETARKRAEQAIRNYDPCISCATHFLDLRVERV
ncbi:MAG: Ni/Fe hydrogenase subunit alpha [Polyangiaceae bacterium]|nr:Ni/Fe hydrogenase subunit alpha [Polyangiaceae bacterium]